MRKTSTLCVLLSMVWVVIGAATPAHAYSAKGYVTYVTDGDTVGVDVYGDGTKTPVHIRMGGIQTMEIGSASTTSDDACHARAAQVRMGQLVYHKVVTLTASKTSSSSMGRPIRYVFKDGVDIGAIMIKEGHAIPWASGAEDSRVERYARLAVTAASNGLKIWDKDTCGSGPSQSTPLSMSLRWDAEGDDRLNPNGEWMRVHNGGSSSMAIGGWKLRDSGLRWFTFPSWAKVPAKGYVTLYVGKGSDYGNTFHWDQSGPVFANSIPDGGYLTDPRGDFRAHKIYFP